MFYAAIAILGLLLGGLLAFFVVQKKRKKNAHRTQFLKGIQRLLKQCEQFKTLENLQSGFYERKIQPIYDQAQNWGEEAETGKMEIDDKSYKIIVNLQSSLHTEAAELAYQNKQKGLS